MAARLLPRAEFMARWVALCFRAPLFIVMLLLLEYRCGRVLHECARTGSRSALGPLLSSGSALRAPVATFGLLFHVPEELTPTCSTEDAARERIYERLSALTAGRELAADPLTSPAAIDVQRALVRKVMAQVFALPMSAAALDILARYGDVAVALCDFLAFCGYGHSLPSELLSEPDLPAFISFAEWRHRRLRAHGAAGHAAAAALASVSSSWAGVKLLVRDYYSRFEDGRIREAWLDVRVSLVQRGISRTRLRLRIRADADLQSFCAGRLAFVIYAKAITTLATVANLLLDSKVEESRRRAEALETLVERLRLDLLSVLRRCDPVRQ